MYHLLLQVVNHSLPRLVVCYDTCIASSQLLVDPGPELFLDAAGVVALEGEEHQAIACLLSSGVNALADCVFGFHAVEMRGGGCVGAAKPV